MTQRNDRTYSAIIDFVEKLSTQINNIYDICPKIFLRFNQENKSGGSAVLAYRISDICIELDIPHNYTFGKVNRVTLACMLVHEYCHYLDALTMLGRERVDNTNKYLNDQEYKRLEEQRNWTATKKLAKKLGLWNKLFYNRAHKCHYTTLLQF